MRIDRFAFDGNPGLHRVLKKGVREMKIDYGPGYRVYFFAQRGGEPTLLLCGGDKRTQRKDIEAAYALVDELET